MYEPFDYAEALRDAFPGASVYSYPIDSEGWGRVDVTTGDDGDQGEWWAFVSLIPQEDGSHLLEIDHPEAEGISWEADPWELAGFLRSERLLLEVNWAAARAKAELL
nr:hypothetical protein [Propionibacterium sp.]